MILRNTQHGWLSDPLHQSPTTRHATRQHDVHSKPLRNNLKGITLGENSDKALTDTSKFVFGLTFRPLSKVFLKGYERRSKVRQLCTTSCSECVHECVNRSGVGVNAQMRPEDSRTLTRQRGSKRGGTRREEERERERGRAKQRKSVV